MVIVRFLKLFGAAVGIVLCSAVAGVVSLPWTVQLLVKEAPSLTDGSAQSPTEVLAVDGSVIATIRPVEKFIPVPDGQLPELLAKVIVTSEDVRFYEHSGVDPVGLARAVYTNVVKGGVVQGGSTITQQVVKNDVVGTRRTYERKAKEALLALRLEQEHSKDEILRRYLDVAYFGHGIRGAETASNAWFGVPAAELTLAQATLLASVLPSPASYSPFDHPERAEQRRQLVLDVLETNKTFPAAVIDRARRDKPTATRTDETPLVDTKHPWVLDTVRGELTRLAPEIDLLAGGLQVRTGIDIELQARAESVIARNLAKADMPDGALVVLDATTGQIRVAVGGADRSRSEVNSALGRLGGGSGRQAGSSFKPIALAAALEAGWTLDDRVEAPASIQLPGREPAYNYDRRNWGQPTLRTATQWSINTAFMNLTSSVGVDEVKRVARGLGLDPRSTGVEIAIGPDEVSPLSLAAAYATFADQGRWHSPHVVVEVVRAGERIWSPVIAERKVLDPSTATLVGEALRSVVAAGTGTRARIAGVDVAGKTGTTDNYADAWFTGWAENLVGSVWVGHLEGQIPMRNVPGWGSISGGSLPAFIWQEVLRDTLQARADERRRTEAALPQPTMSPSRQPDAEGEQANTSDDVPPSGGSQDQVGDQEDGGDGTGDTTSVDTDGSPSDAGGGTGGTNPGPTVTPLPSITPTPSPTASSTPSATASPSKTPGPTVAPTAQTPLSSPAP